jgi:hypothetical protein
MTKAWGLPILMDPRLCGIPGKMGLVSPHLEDYKAILHEHHYEWHLRARQYDITRMRAMYDADLARKQALAAMVGATSNEQEPIQRTTPTR